jgi:hypothetical protein
LVNRFSLPLPSVFALLQPSVFALPLASTFFYGKPFASRTWHCCLPLSVSAATFLLPLDSRRSRASCSIFQNIRQKRPPDFIVHF